MNKNSDAHSEDAVLHVTHRTAKTKSESNQIRRSGGIPAVIYSKGKTPGEYLVVNSAEYQAIVRHIQPGRLSTTKFTLVDDKGHKRRAYVKEIQYKVTNYDVTHLDFEEIFNDVQVAVKVPVECVKAAECPGVKLGGVLRQVIRKVRVLGLPKDIPAYFELDVSQLDRSGRKTINDLNIPQTLRPLVANMNEVVCVIVKR